MTASRTALVVCVALLSGLAVRAAEPGQFQTAERYSMSRSETHVGDLYVFAGIVDIDGLLDGDLVAWASGVTVTGDVRGDLVAAGANVRIRGNIGDSARVMAGDLEIDGTVDGDVIAFAGRLVLAEGARVTGNLVVCSGMAQVKGEVDGDLQFVGGEVALSGRIASDASIKADRVRLGDGAEIGGDLDYSSRRELEMDDGATVAGEIHYEPLEEDESGSHAMFPRAYGWGFWLWLMIGAMFCGLTLVALARQAAPAIVETIDREALVGGLVGFGAFLIFPAAAGLSIVLIVTLPLGVLALLIYLIALYLAKLPVSLWVGNRLLRLLGRGEPSPFLAVVLGMPVLYLAFALPYAGRVLWFVTAWLGLGSIILVTRSYVTGRKAA